jgi:pyruvate dehydrogenase (quinone)/pyruvate oxidase
VAQLTLRQDIIAARAEGGVSSVDTLRPRPELAASKADLANIARQIDQAK